MRFNREVPYGSPRLCFFLFALIQWRTQPFQAKELVIIATGDVTTSSLPVAGIGSPEILSWRFSLSSQR